MAEITTGLDALEMFDKSNGESEKKNEFTYLKSGKNKTIKVLSLNDIMFEWVYTAYGVFKSFIPESKPKVTNKGYPLDNYTPFDLAYLYHKERSEDWTDEESQKAQVYKLQPKFSVGGIDLDTGEPIVMEFSKNQFADIKSVLEKNSKKLGKKAFEIEKSADGKGKITTTPLDLDDLTPAQLKEFENAPEEFGKDNFSGLYYVRDEEAMIELLNQVGFDVTLIGYDRPSADDSEPAQAEEVSEDPTENF